MIDLALFLSLFISIAAFIYINKQSPEAEVPSGKLAKPKVWYFGLILSSKYLRQAGIQVTKLLIPIFLLKTSCAILAYVLIIIAELQPPLILKITTIISGFFVPELIFVVIRYQRKQAIEGSFEFFLQVFLVYLKAGFSLEQALSHSISHGLSKKNPLFKELKLFVYEVSAGKEKHAAFEFLYYRTGVKEVKKLSNLLLVGSTLGTPLVNSIESLLESYELKKSVLLAKRINRKSLHTTFPILLICFPMFLVLVFFPSALQVMNVLSLLVDSI
ncbi:type II secretion system F family protein [Pseudoalteromonas sp. BZK2]|jgi:Flp pilus assembly protein TadB|uniref:type II secretion system F family protein n=1 Tax=Pseudoalteromonas sp. BZK2 TaxID=1904458 RepID=UPI0016545291|nr:type II secretion system F family protein [Pseudoalteromonas sp. BZK2]MBC7010652.1 type II secretion system F family protein [Pseudoalteromonas sp. BZK2]